jgi:hypothetical protein
MECRKKRTKNREQSFAANLLILGKVLIVTLYVKVYFIRCIKNAMPGMSRAWRYGLQPGFDLIFCADSGWIFFRRMI